MMQAYRGEGCHVVFFDGKHEDCKNQIGRDEHFDEYALSGVDSILQTSAANPYYRHHHP